jgi:hypothetical protein
MKLTIHINVVPGLRNQVEILSPLWFNYVWRDTKLITDKTLLLSRFAEWSTPMRAKIKRIMPINKIFKAKQILRKRWYDFCICEVIII